MIRILDDGSVLVTETWCCSSPHAFRERRQQLTENGGVHEGSGAYPAASGTTIYLCDVCSRCGARLYVPGSCVPDVLTSELDRQRSQHAGPSGSISANTLGKSISSNTLV